MSTQSPNSRRDMFAAAALQGLLADSTVGGPPESVAMMAVQYADALIAELDRPVATPIVPAKPSFHVDDRPCMDCKHGMTRPGVGPCEVCFAAVGWPGFEATL